LDPIGHWAYDALKDLATRGSGGVCKAFLLLLLLLTCTQWRRRRSVGDNHNTLAAPIKTGSGWMMQGCQIDEKGL
jgi:hypothetical protein